MFHHACRRVGVARGLGKVGGGVKRNERLGIRVPLSIFVYAILALIEADAPQFLGMVPLSLPRRHPGQIIMADPCRDQRIICHGEP